MHFASASGSENFRLLETLVNMLLHMANFYDVTSSSHHVGAGFRKFALNILTDSVADVIERILRLESPKKKRSAAATAAGANHDFSPYMPVAEEVTEMLMRGFVDDPRQSKHAASFASEESFSFHADVLRSHSEATKVASRSDLLERLHQMYVTFNIRLLCIFVHLTSFKEQDPG